MINQEKIEKFFEIHKEELEKGFIEEHEKWDITFSTTNVLISEYSNMYNMFNEENPIQVEIYNYNEFCKTTLEIVKKHFFKINMDELTSVSESDFLNYIFNQEKPTEALLETSENIESSREAAKEIVNNKIKQRIKLIYGKMLLPELVVHKVGYENVIRIKEKIIKSLEDSNKEKDITMMSEFYKVIEEINLNR